MYQKLRVENVVTHGGQAHAFLARDGRRVLRLFVESNHAARFIHRHNPKLARRFFYGHLHATDSHIRVILSVERQEDTIIHFVHMVS